MSHFVSTGFAWGFILGFLANRLYCLLHAMWLDRHRPLPDGKHRSKLQAISIDPRAAAALVMILAVGWSLYRTQENTNTSARITAEAREFAAATRACQKQLIVAINLNRGITAEYNEKANEQRTALADWLKTLLDPPPNIRNLSPSDPVRQQWGIDVTTRYYDTIQKAQRDQENADASRPRYPDPDCGE